MTAARVPLAERIRTPEFRARVEMHSRLLDLDEVPNPHGRIIGWDCRDCSAYWAAYEGQTPRGWTRDSHGRAVCPRCRKGAK